MTVHHGVLDALTSKVGYIIGFFSTAAAGISASVRAPINVMDYIWLEFGTMQAPVQVTVQNGLTFLTAITGLVIGIAALKKEFGKKK